MRSAPSLRLNTFSYMDEKKEIIDSYLDRFLPSESEPPQKLHQAIRYSVFSGGKRFRPILAVTSFEALNGKGEKIYPAACALELIHTFSLIHDDLPCMDNDYLRRGKPTLHRVFGESLAVLTGDALLARAFSLLAASESLQVISEVAQAIGSAGLLGGQVLDIEAKAKKFNAHQIDHIKQIHEWKTGQLIRVSVRLGGLLAYSSAAELSSLSQYGEKLGLAFQIVDDILDFEENGFGLDNQTGSERGKEKATYPMSVGIIGARQIAVSLISEAKQILHPLGERSVRLQQLADFILQRLPD